MDIGAVMDEVGDALDTIAGLRVFRFPPDAAAPPFGIVAWPSDITFDATYGRGSDRLTLPVIVGVARSNDRAAWAQLGPYCDGSGAASVKAVVEGHTYTACDPPRVTRVEFAPLVLGGTEYEAAFFDLDISGSGS